MKLTSAWVRAWLNKTQARIQADERELALYTGGSGKGGKEDMGRKGEEKGEQTKGKEKRREISQAVSAESCSALSF